MKIVSDFSESDGSRFRDFSTVFDKLSGDMVGQGVSPATTFRDYPYVLTSEKEIQAGHTRLTNRLQGSVKL